MENLQKPTAGLLTILSVLGRLLPHPPNFTPLTGATLFGGATLTKPWNYLLPIATLFVTDMFLGFYTGMYYTYGSFLLIALIGSRLLKNKPSLIKVAGVSLVSSILFFTISNFGVWQAGGLYPHTAAGLMESYVMGLPFFRNTLLGDLIFSTGFFGLYQWAESRQYVQKVDGQVNNLLHQTIDNK